MAKRGQNQFEHGYFCAVATLLRMEGCVSAQIRELFVSGGDASKANRHDIETFREHGLLPECAADAAETRDAKGGSNG